MDRNSDSRLSRLRNIRNHNRLDNRRFTQRNNIRGRISPPSKDQRQPTQQLNPPNTVSPKILMAASSRLNGFIPLHVVRSSLSHSISTPRKRRNIQHKPQSLRSSSWNRKCPKSILIPLLRHDLWKRRP